MKWTIKPLLVAAMATTMLASCDDKLEVFETVGYMGHPAMVENIVATSLPGQIQLEWEAPSGDFAYMKINYYDYLQKKEVYHIVSKGTTELLIDETRARFGEYAFTFQTFNANDEAGESKMIKALSGSAPATNTLVSRSQFALQTSQLSTNAQEPSEGPIRNAVDGNVNSFFHTRWSSPQIPLPQWIQVDFTEEHQNFIVGYVNRYDNTWTSEGRPSVVELQTSNDGENWTTVGTLSGLPTAAKSEYTSTYVMPEEPFTYFRFTVTSTSGSTKYWNIAEFYFYDAEVEIYDPETIPLD